MRKKMMNNFVRVGMFTLLKLIFISYIIKIILQKIVFSLKKSLKLIVFSFCFNIFDVETVGVDDRNFNWSFVISVISLSYIFAGDLTF
jgi:hypothetical protein